MRKVRGFAVKFYTDEGSGKPGKSSEHSATPADAAMVSGAADDEQAAVSMFIDAMSAHRFYTREMDTQRV